MHGHIEQPPANEDAPFAPGDVYQRTKLEAEQLRGQFGQRHGLDVVVARPIGIYGPGDRRFLKMFRGIARGRFPMLGPGTVFYHLTYIDDLVRGLELCGIVPPAAGRTYILAGPEYTTLSRSSSDRALDARPYGKYSMVDIDRVGGIQVIVREFLDAGLLNGDVMTCTGETLAAQVKRLGAGRADGKVIYSVDKPYKPTGGLRVLGGNLSPDFSAILKLAGVEGGLENNIFRGKARNLRGRAGPARRA